jgi:hypothetical protein
VNSEKRRAPKVLEAAWGYEEIVPIGSRLSPLEHSLTTTAPTPNGLSAHQQKGDDNQYSGVVPDDAQSRTTVSAKAAPSSGLMGGMGGMDY